MPKKRELSEAEIGQIVLKKQRVRICPTTFPIVLCKLRFIDFNKNECFKIYLNTGKNVLPSGKNKFWNVCFFQIASKKLCTQLNQ